jgi:hypothetical protein
VLGSYDDAELRRLCERFRARPAGVRNALTTDDFYALLAFAGRAAVAAMRQSDATWIADGLTAVAMIDDERIDARDLDPSLGIVRHAAMYIGADAGALFAEAARHATRSVARAFQRDALPAPRVLLRIALDVDAILERDGYRIEDVTLAASLPEAWIDAPPPASGVVTMHARHRDNGEQIAIAFIAETAGAQSVHPVEHDAAALLVTHENLLCLLIARVETTASLQRFLEPIRHALAISPVTPAP